MARSACQASFWNGVPTRSSGTPNAWRGPAKYSASSARVCSRMAFMPSRAGPPRAASTWACSRSTPFWPTNSSRHRPRLLAMASISPSGVGRWQYSRVMARLMEGWRGAPFYACRFSVKNGYNPCAAISASYQNSILDAALCRHAGLEGVLDQLHLGHRIGHGDDLLGAAPARQAHVHVLGARGQGVQHLGERQPAVDQRVGDLVEHDEEIVAREDGGAGLGPAV